MEGGSRRVLCNLIFSDKITNNLLIPHSSSVWLSLLLSHSHVRTHPGTHTKIQTRSQALCCQQSPLTVYHSCGNSSSVVYEKNASKNKHENVDVTHKEPHHARFTVSSECCFPLSGNKCQSSKTGLQAATINFSRLS